MAGVFLADAVKGSKWKSFPQPIADGILIHRKMDQITDDYPGFDELKQVLSPGFGHWRGVLIDLFLDHILARHWSSFHNSELEDHSQHLFALLEPYQNQFPDNIRLLYQAMSSTNWLLAYREHEGIARAFYGMNRRIKLKNPLDQAPKILLSEFELIEQSCLDFLNHIQSYSWQ